MHLGLCINGFNPFRLFVALYSCWPIILTVYNFPPEMCMRLKFLFLSIVILSFNSLGLNIDVCLRPLINELKQLWSSGVLIYDVSRKQNFQMKAILMWTINDFLEYEMVSSLRTHGKLACPYCIKNKKAFMLTNNNKTSFFFYFHQQFLLTGHKYRKNIKDFFIGRVEKDVALPLFSSE